MSDDNTWAFRIRAIIPRTNNCIPEKNQLIAKHHGYWTNNLATKPRGKFPRKLDSVSQETVRKGRVLESFLRSTKVTS